MEEFKDKNNDGGQGSNNAPDSENNSKSSEINNSNSEINDFEYQKTKAYENLPVPDSCAPQNTSEASESFSSDPFSGNQNELRGTIRTSSQFDISQIPLDRNTNILAETTAGSSINCGNAVTVLLKKYSALTASQNIFNQEQLSLEYVLGAGNQGVVYFSERLGTDSFRLPVALKFFSPDGFRTEDEYKQVMNHNAKVASAVAMIQHDNLLDVRNWFMLNDIRVMEMEWVDGYDLFQLMTNDVLNWMSKNLSPNDFSTKTDVVITYGPVRPRLKPGIALTIIRNCLDALSALHQCGIVHGDIKPANIMLKKTGRIKIIDLGAAFFYAEKPPFKLCTPFYAAPEILNGNRVELPTPQSDIASLGYVLIELLSGRSPFENVDERGGQKFISAQELLQQKFNLIHHLDEILPDDVLQNPMLVDFCRRMIHPDRSIRFQTAKSAVVELGGVADILRGLIKYNLASEFDYDIQSWISLLKLPRKHTQKI